MTREALRISAKKGENIHGKTSKLADEIFLSEVHMFFKLFIVRLLLFTLFPIAFVFFAASGAFEALYEFLSESEAYYEKELRTRPENPVL